ncbi:MAG: glycosyltransferase family 8 protein [Clostridia bacterium]|nr:glycosyltransferase family 8 protein [Clostridia bacterium]
MNILYTLNDKFVPQVAAGICSVCENNKEVENITFYLISKEITNENKNKLINFSKKYGRETIIIELGDIKNYFDFEFDTTGWNSIVLARLVLDKLLPKEINKVLYLDGDTIVRGSIEELWNINLSNHVLAASIEPTVDKIRKEKLGLKGYPYYNAGVLLINLEKWRNEKIGKKILDFYKKNDGKLFANDQDAINGALKDNIYTLLPKYNFYNIFYQYPYKFLNKLMEDVKYFDYNQFQQCVKNPIIIHYLGEERPWRKGNHHKYKNDYEKYLNLTPWAGKNYETGWRTYFIFWYIFNFITKPFPGIRYKIINSLIPTIMKIRSKKVKKEK